jgi:hypothetical protein
MAKMTELTNSKRLGLRPRLIIVPLELEDTAHRIIMTDKVTTSTGQFDRSVVYDRYGIEQPIVVDYWTDATDWIMCCAPNENPVIEIGFLDGKEEPEIFVSDLPNVGSLFTNDRIDYKIRHIYGGAVLDYRTAYKHVVSA